MQHEAEFSSPATVAHRANSAHRALVLFGQSVDPVLATYPDHYGFEEPGLFGAFGLLDLRWGVTNSPLYFLGRCPLDRHNPARRNTSRRVRVPLLLREGRDACLNEKQKGAIQSQTRLINGTCLYAYTL